MTQEPKPAEPSMEDILASIRKIIADEPEQSVSADSPAQEPSAKAIEPSGSDRHRPAGSTADQPPTAATLNTAPQAVIASQQPAVSDLERELADLLAEPAPASPSEPQPQSPEPPQQAGASAAPALERRPKQPPVAEANSALQASSSDLSSPPPAPRLSWLRSKSRETTKQPTNAPQAPSLPPSTTDEASGGAQPETPKPGSVEQPAATDRDQQSVAAPGSSALEPQLPMPSSPTPVVKPATVAPDDAVQELLGRLTRTPEPGSAAASGSQTSSLTPSEAAPANTASGGPAEPRPDAPPAAKDGGRSPAAAVKQGTGSAAETTQAAPLRPERADATSSGTRPDAQRPSQQRLREPPDQHGATHPPTPASSPPLGLTPSATPNTGAEHAKSARPAPLPLSGDQPNAPPEQRGQLVSDQPGATGSPSTTSASAEPSQVALDDLLADMLRPMVRQWLDDNMTRALEKAVRIEVAEGIKSATSKLGGSKKG